MTLRLFLDRSVGTRKIAAALRAQQLDVETIADRYGAANPTIRDEQWIAEASRTEPLSRGWIGRTGRC